MGAAPYNKAHIAHEYESFYDLSCPDIEGVELCGPDPSVRECVCGGRGGVKKAPSACLTDLTEVKFEEFKGKVVLIVNVATNSSTAKKNYDQLNALYNKYHNDGLEILAFPCNQFGGQEPGPNSAIQKKVDDLYCPEFKMLTKIDVNGKQTHDVYKFLRSATLPNQTEDSNEIKGNFTKFVVDCHGKVVLRSPPDEYPEFLDHPDKLCAWLEEASPEGESY